MSGLIGASLGLALKREGIAGMVTGVGRTLENLETAKRIGAVDAISRDIAEGASGAELVVVAVPPHAYTRATVQEAAKRPAIPRRDNNGCRLRPRALL